MKGVVVDAGVAMAWLLPSPHSRAAHALIDQAPCVWAPDVVALDVAERLLSLVRTGELDAADVPDLLEVLHAVPVSFRLSAPLVTEATRLALEFDVSLTAALGLALASLHDLAFVTADGDLAAHLRAFGFGHDVRWLGDALPPDP